MTRLFHALANVRGRRGSGPLPDRPGMLCAAAFRAIVEQRYARVCHHLSKDVPGAAIPSAIQAAYAEGDVVHTCVRGRDARGRVMTAETPFRLASQSKPVTTLLALRMVDAGVIGLEDCVWPGLRAWTPAAEQAAGHDFSRITLRHLLSHTSGWNMARLPSRPATRVAGAPTVVDLLRGGVEGMEDSPRMLFGPGEQIEYSAIGFAILELVLEQAGGKPFEKLLHEYVARPLGLKTLSAARPHADEQPVAIGMRSPPENVPGDDAFFIARGASGMTATAGELARLFSIAACAAKGEHDFLKRDTARAMFAASPAARKDYAFGLGFALADWAPDTVFKHAGYSDGCCGVTEGFVGEGCAVSVQATASHPGGKMMAQRITGAVLEGVRAARENASGARAGERAAERAG